MTHDLEFLADEHIYLVDGVITPSVTQVLKKKFGNMYANVPRKTLQAAAERGTSIHKQIENYVNGDEYENAKEVKNFKFLQRMHQFEPLDSELPLVLEHGSGLVAGTADLLIKIDDVLALADIKTTSALNKEYLFYQLNLYRMGIQQTYGYDICKLYGIHLRGDTRKLVEIPVNWGMAKEVLDG